jgi:hypothetical protein
VLSFTFGVRSGGAERHAGSQPVLFIARAIRFRAANTPPSKTISSGSNSDGSGVVATSAEVHFPYGTVIEVITMLLIRPASNLGTQNGTKILQSRKQQDLIA